MGQRASLGVLPRGLRGEERPELAEGGRHPPRLYAGPWLRRERGEGSHRVHEVRLREEVGEGTG